MLLKLSRDLEFTVLLASPNAGFKKDGDAGKEAATGLGEYVDQLAHGVES